MAKKSSDMEASAPVANSIKVGKTIVSLTNQQKIYFPGEGITKGDMILLLNIYCLI